MDEELVRRAAAGDSDAFASLIGPRFPRLYGLASLIIVDRASVDDAVQEALIRAWRDLSQLREAAKFDSWLRRLIVNASHDQDRRARRRPVLQTAVAPEPWIEGPERRLVLEDEIVRALRQLSHADRAVIALRFYLERSTEESGGSSVYQLGQRVSACIAPFARLRRRAIRRRTQPVGQRRHIHDWCTGRA